MVMRRGVTEVSFGMFRQVERFESKFDEGDIRLAVVEPEKSMLIRAQTMCERERER